MTIPVVGSTAGLPEKFFHLFVQNNNPLLLVISGWLVYEADSHAFRNRTFNKLMSSTLAIYLITDAINIRPLLTQALLPEVMRGIGFVYIFIVCAVCLLADRIRMALFSLLYEMVSKIKKIQSK